MVDFSLLPRRLQASVSVEPFHTWAFPDGTLWTEFYRANGGYLLRFPDLADFEVSADGLDVVCFPAPEVSEATARHLYMNQVLPLVLSKLGKLVFHASAYPRRFEGLAGVRRAIVEHAREGSAATLERDTMRLAQDLAAQGLIRSA